MGCGQMKIKERIALSNTLMVVIPSLLLVVLLGLGVLMFYFTFIRDTDLELVSEWERDEVREDAIQMVQDFFSSGDPISYTVEAEALEEELKENDMQLCVISNGSEVLHIGMGEIPGEEKMLQAIEQLSGNGVVQNDIYELFAQRAEVDGDIYQIYLYTPRQTILSHTVKMQLIAFSFLLVAVLLAAVVISHRILSHRVFMRIEKPMDQLSEGVQQIRDGNLNYQILYDQPDEFGAICAEFNEMARRLQVSEEMERKNSENRREMMADISHDLRSPLTSILAYVEGLEDGVADTPEKQKKYLDIIKMKTTDIDRLVKKLFLFSKMDMGDYPYFPEELDIGEEVADFVEAARENYEKQGITIILGDLPDHAMIYADPTYFRSILTNLLDNSAKYKKEGRGHVWITLADEGDQIRMLLDDDGPGVDEGELKQIFDVFYRTDRSRKDPNKGSGLGLAIVAKVVGKMGGSIHAENLMQGGLRMVITLPLMEGEKKS